MRCFIEWNYRKWPLKYRYLIIIIAFILSTIFFATKGHAEETISGHITEDVFDTLAATAAFIGAAEQVATGNIVTGVILATLGGKEINNAYDEFKAAWYLYREPNNENDSDRDISPTEANWEHGRD